MEVLVPAFNTLAARFILGIKGIGVTVIAGVVMLQAQADFLVYLGCHAYQRHLFSRPLPLEAQERCLRRSSEALEHFALVVTTQDAINNIATLTESVLTHDTVQFF